MLISKNWLETMVDVPDDIKGFCDRLDLTGTGVEGVERTGAKLDGIVVGHILTREAHPDSDHLWVTTVDVGNANLGEGGTPEPLQIVCGAQNFDAGDKVPVATVGTVMPDGTRIKKSKLRGVASCGMNCSGREIGVSSDHSGLLILPPDAPVGMPIADYLGISDTVIDLEITPNRPDCLSMTGMAREVGAMYDIDYIPEHYDLVEGDGDVTDLVSVEIEDPELCPRYTARVVKNLKVGPSPDWLARRVTACGARSINNLVDVTNYIMFLFGQPLHAFDYDRMRKSDDGKVHVVVRAAHDGEPFTTLDNVDRVLTSDMAVITDGAEPVALAGVMGGLDTEISDDTTTVLLESATFSTSHTSRTSRNLSLMSEAALRYERGVDAASAADISAQAAALLAQVGGGEVCRGVVDVYPVEAVTHDLVFRVGRFCDFVGADVPKDDCIRILSRLGCEVSDQGETLAVHAPTFRPDLEREIDLYEEVLRLWGMAKVTPTLPGGRGRIGGRTTEQRTVARIGEVLRAAGLNETTTYSLCPDDDLQRLRMSSEGRGEAVELINPMSSEQNVMRQSIIPGLLRSVSYNQNRGTGDVQLYEEGKVFFAAAGRKQPREKKLVAGVLCGSWNEEQWNEPRRELGFFDAKGVLETLLRELAVGKVRFKALDAQEAPHLQPGRAAEVLAGGSQLGWVGEIHPLALADFDVTGPVAAFELDEKALLHVARDMRDYHEVARFPAVDIDLALVVDEGVTADELVSSIEHAGGSLLESVRLFDVYRDEKRLGAGKKSLAFSLVYRAADKTLTSEEAEHQHARIVKKVCAKTGAEVRS
ncbi:MAG: phenylalanine--tRNA ligase subunit beta [Coriobacteriales bacterium]